MSDLDQVTTVYKICYAVIAAPQSNTTNLFNHLKSSYKIVFDQAIKEQKEKALSTPDATGQLSIQDTLYNATTYSTSSQRHKEITNAITFFLAKNQCPINTGHNPGFKNLVNTLEKCSPSRHHFSRVSLPALYNECREHVEKLNILPPQRTCGQAAQWSRI